MALVLSYISWKPLLVVMFGVTLVKAECPKNCISCDSSECTQCVHGYYGNNCQQNCNETHCRNGVCPMYGTCFKGCKDGWYGAVCDKKCDVINGKLGSNCSLKKGCKKTHCKDGKCPVWGSCIEGCKPGWQGSKCNKRCFGQICKKCAKSHCKNGACPTKNSCLQGCKDGWYGSLCDKRCDMESSTFVNECKKCSKTYCKEGECPVLGFCINGCQGGWDGVVCDKCSKAHCKDGECPILGFCVRGCKDGWEGTVCDECPRMHCRDDTCPVRGSCVNGCKDGWHGLACDKQCTECTGGECCNATRTNIVIFICISVLIVLMAVIGIICFIKICKRKGNRSCKSYEQRQNLNCYINDASAEISLMPLASTILSAGYSVSAEFTAKSDAPAVQSAEVKPELTPHGYQLAEVTSTSVAACVEINGGSIIPFTSNVKGKEKNDISGTDSVQREEDSVQFVAVTGQHTEGSIWSVAVRPQRAEGCVLPTVVCVKGKRNSVTAFHSEDSAYPAAGVQRAENGVNPIADTVKSVGVKNQPVAINTPHAETCHICYNSPPRYDFSDSPPSYSDAVKFQIL